MHGMSLGHVEWLKQYFKQGPWLVVSLWVGVCVCVCLVVLQTAAGIYIFGTSILSLSKDIAQEIKAIEGQLFLYVWPSSD